MQAWISHPSPTPCVRFRRLIGNLLLLEPVAHVRGLPDGLSRHDRKTLVNGAQRFPLQSAEIRGAMIMQLCGLHNFSVSLSVQLARGDRIIQKKSETILGFVVYDPLHKGGYGLTFPLSQPRVRTVVIDPTRLQSVSGWLAPWFGCAVIAVFEVFICITS